MGNGATWAMWTQGAMGYMGVWGTWAMRPTGAKWYRGYGVHRP